MKLKALTLTLIITFYSYTQDFVQHDISNQEIAVLSKIYTSIEQGAQELFTLINNSLPDVEKQASAKKRIEEIINYYDSICFLPLLYLATAAIADDYSLRFNKTTPSDLQEIGVSFEQVSKNFAAMSNEFRRKATYAYIHARTRLKMLTNTSEQK